MEQFGKPAVTQQKVLKALAHHQHLIVLPEGNGVVPQLWVGSADIAALKQAGWIEQASDLGSTTVWEITPQGRAVVDPAGE